MATRGVKRAAESSAESKDLLQNAFLKQAESLSNLSGMWSRCHSRAHEKILGLVDKTWQLYRLSPLHKFATDASFLKTAMKVLYWSSVVLHNFVIRFYRLL
jgi:hypothetical protein